MIIEDINGNVITNPDLNRGRLEKAAKDDGFVYVYFPFTEEEQQEFDLVNRSQSDQDAAICELYEMIAEVQ